MFTARNNVRIFKQKKDMTKANQLRKMFPDFISHVSIDLNEHKTIVFLDVPSNIISISWRFPASCGCCMDCEIDDSTLDCTEDGVNEFDDDEFNCLVEELKQLTN
jgi:hypothetical protein